MGKSRGFASVLPWITAAILFSASILYLEGVHRVAAGSEPDQYFHLALGRQMAEQGLARTLPQAEQTAWKDHFTNDYFLFSALVAAAWKTGAEKAALGLVPLLTLILFLLLFAFARRYLPWWLAMAVPLFLLLNSTTLPRLLTLRPSLLAEIWMVGLAFSIVSGNRVGVLVCAFCFPMSYHAIYFPLYLLGLAAAVGYGFGNHWPKLAAQGAAALLAGVVFNPYFPHTLSMIGAVFAALLVPSTVPESEISMEATGWGKELFLGRLPLFAAILGITAWRVVAELLLRTKSKKANHPLWEAEFAFLFALSLSFCALVFLSFRAIEYAAPFSLIFFAIFAARHTKTAGQAASLVAAGALLLLPDAFKLLYVPMKVWVEPLALQQAIQALPMEARGKKVFNCDWFTGGPLLYWRPDMRFVDLADPHAVEAAHPGLSLLKNQMRAGSLPYLFGPIHYAFGADYVLCQGSRLVEAMDASPHFRRIFPSLHAKPAPVEANVFTVHQVATERHPAFVANFEQLEKEKWVPWDAGSKLKPEQRSPFLALATKEMDCTVVRPTREEMQRHQGAQFLGVGGGPALMVELNGRRLFARQHWSAFNTLDVLVPLPHKIAPTDTILVRACRLRAGERMGVAVSLWTQAQVQATCEWKGLPMLVPTLGGADFADKPTQLCLGTLAARNGLQ